MNRLLAPLFYSPALDAIFSSESTIAAMLRVELALSRAWGLDCAALEKLTPQDFDVTQLGQDGAEGSNINIPFVKALKQKAGNQHHKGATSQDILDSAMVLQVLNATKHLNAEKYRLERIVKTLAMQHLASRMCARTLLQPALPTTFGLKLALFYHELKSLTLTAPNHLQLGGAAGTQSAFTREIAAKMAAELGLHPAPPTHVFRSNLHLYGAMLTSLSVTLGKMAGDMMLLMQAEVGEVKEGAKEGRGGSSAMAHKRNPAISTLIKACALETPPLLSALYMSGFSEHERAAGAWQTEWLNLPLLVKLTGSALEKSVILFESLEIYPAKMQENYEKYLAPHLSEADKSIDSAVHLAQDLLN